MGKRVASKKKVATAKSCPNERRHVFWIILIISALTAAVAMNEEARQLSQRDRLLRGDTYDRLEAKCSDACCRASVDEMRLKRATVQPQTGCTAGQKADVLRCGSSYRWCEPVR